MVLQDVFSPATATWFDESFPGPTPAQAAGWPAIAAGDHTLIHAPTGSGKTLAAFLYTLDRVLTGSVPPRESRCRVLYISPMKALAHDVERNLRAPLTGIGHAAARRGSAPLPDVAVAIRTGDTPAADRRRMQKHPPDILITTPESLFLILTSQARRMLASVRWVIVDEVHAVAGTKRGSHLALSLERLEEIARRPPQRIGLSATQRPLPVIAEFLGGGMVDGPEWTPRPVTIVDVPSDRGLEVEIVVPVEDMAAPAPPDPLSSDPTDVGYRSIWPSVYPRLVDLIRAHRSTIVFANSRRLAERLCAELNNLADGEIARAHHGSVSREQRLVIEDMLKRGEIPAVVATSTLELGIDMGAVDLVIHIESPTSVASGLQRVGRAGHQVGATSLAKVFPKFRGDLLEAAVVTNLMLSGNVEPTVIPQSPLDVLAQQIVAAVSMDEWNVDDLYRIMRGAGPYRDLRRGPYEAVLDMLAGRYPSELFGELRPRLVWDRVTHTLSARSGAQRLAVTNAGTIPDRGLYSVNLPDGSRVGELDEEMVYESRPGDVFILGTSTWRITDITPDRVEVIPAPGEPAARMPFWRGDRAGRTLDTGRAIGRFVRRIAALEPEVAVEALTAEHHLDPWASANLVAFIAEQKEATGVLPTDQTVVVERFRDEIGDWRIAVLSPLGARIHAPWAMAINQRLRRRYGRSVDVIWSDDGISFRFVDTEDLPTLEDLLIDPDELESVLIDELSGTAVFAARFREAAARALLLPRRRPGGRTPLWLQRRRASDLMAIVTRFGSFPIVLETYREILQDVFDLPACEALLRDIRSRKVRIVEVDTDTAGPFASSLLFQFVASYLYEGDTAPAERRAAALTLDRELLRDLLGEGELRELLNEDVVTSVELELQRLAEGRKVMGIDGVHDLLRAIGPLDESGVQARLRDGDAIAILAGLEAARRAIRIQIMGKPVWAAIEDAGRLRDALGVQPPAGTPLAFLDSEPDPLSQVVGRYARTHGPFTPGEAGSALGLPPAVIRNTLGMLEQNGKVIRGAFRPGGAGQEWVDAAVLRRLKRRSLAVLRREIEAVEQAALGRFLPGWQAVGRTGRRHIAALLEVVRLLQGAPLPASILERDVLASRLDYTPGMLDQLMASGEVVWIGHAPIGPRDGRVALYLREQLPILHRPGGQEQPQSAVHDSIRSHLSQRGASFFRDIHMAAGVAGLEDTLEALWDLVWSGEVTNDTLAPLRALGMRKVRRRSGRLRPHMPSAMPPSSSGRWSLVADLCSPPVTDAEWAAAWAELLLERHGVLTRAGALAENVPGGLTTLYPVLNHLEETGRIRRGYFVEGLGGLQFALPGAIDRLRTTERTGGVVILAAADPANPYGTLLPWPEPADGRASRSAGAYVTLHDGNPLVFLERGGKRAVLLTSDPGLHEAAATALMEIGLRNPRLTIETIDGQPATDHALGSALLESGFAVSLRGLAYRGH
ncbi:MAG: DEAD/DEAH box helicase [bacterium]|nr:DEAD/DEAH box helicase [bacterium]